MSEKSMHEKIANKISGLRNSIETGFPLPGGNTMVNQKAEKDLLEVIDWYKGHIDHISTPDLEKIIDAFKKCTELHFWYTEIQEELKKVINKLEKEKQSRVKL